ncbi:flagellar basal body rod protein FlgC [Paractinoplanes brasiliensis]|jgi:flagellar basal-body rod protein FlgC|uniref:Flagellar basal-body rod protein FlgC n=1 Tax=Paractinoplanes brasiliensis TaxID=52695 RepID=A0A4R6JTN5_9ACTN|nr:flagellar basal body rod C-terminal domain-containing protein [Actinoplanes brasiliensis]MDY7084789.1 flagellar basal body rod C-terminal domain-containing protein [Actinomycetota bacterium]TDO40030.1 flagellar basal-body rod protein FlgC [Actinoplanes brasiliensis]GID25095.1 flagellar basal-body rod protein FlgC [Actinoplanes brasiliensis]
MSTFNAIGVAGTGVTVYRKWLDAVSDNIANMDNTSRTSEKAFQARYVIAQEAQDGNGAQVGGVAFGSAEGVLVHDPDNPLADNQGYVRKPDIDLGSQMAQMMMAQRAYQANLAVVDRAKDSYTAAINLGK